MKKDIKPVEEEEIMMNMGPEDVRAALSALMGVDSPTRAEVDAVKDDLEQALANMKDLSAKMATLKYTTVTIDGAAFNMSVTVPELELSTILSTLEGFYDRMIQKNIYAEAKSDGGCDDAAFN